MHCAITKNGTGIEHEVYPHQCCCWSSCKVLSHYIWNNPVKFKDVLIHLGDFHGMMEFFSIIGKIIQGNGFEDIVYQAGLCTSGGSNGVLTGKHYNRSWVLYESFAEGLEWLFCKSQCLTCPAQFWITYLQLTERQHKLHLSINLNDFDLRLHC